MNPTAPIGDHDWKPTPTGKIVVDYLHGKLNAFVNTGLNVADAAETAQGHLLAAERGRTGERYILGSENLTLQQILSELANITGQKPPRTEIPYAVAYLGKRDGKGTDRATRSGENGTQAHVGLARQGRS